MRSLLQVFGSWRMFIVFLLGFSSGLPLALTGATLQAWMKKEGVDLTTIGVFSLVGLPYTIKFLWAPLMDRFIPPFFGRRRGWMVITQAALMAMIAIMAFVQPAQQPGLMAIVALLVSFFSASQDIVVDAYRTEVLPVEELGAGSGVNIMGYRIGMLVSGALTLILSDHISWQAIYLLLAASMLVGMITSAFLAPEPKVDALPPRTLTEAVVLPFREFMKRPGAVEILIFFMIYKVDSAMATALTTPFLLEMGFSGTDIGSVTKVFGMIAVIAGGLTGGAFVYKIGIKKSLWIFGILQAISGLSFMVLARLGHHYPMMVTSIAAENFCLGMAGSAYSAFMASLCDKRYTATQFALLTSLMAVTRVIISAPTGYLAEQLGWEQFFLATTLLGIPGLLLLTRFNKWQRSSPPFG